jgi:hypothetical protein
MNKLILSFALLISFSGTAQRKVLLEEHTGAKCSQCPMGAHFFDSMLQKHPNVIGVSLHSYGSKDAMHIASFDTMAYPYASGAAPLGSIDRVYWGTGSYVAIYQNQWDAKIQQRLALPNVMNISFGSINWNATTRVFAAKANMKVLSNLPAGDYRVALYVVEDSIVGSGIGYDQFNAYDAMPGNPFFGKGNPIVGYVHRHVVRAVLPSAWGAQGVITSVPMAGDSFTYTFNYQVPASFNADRISLVAFAYRYSTDHMGDTVLNVTESKLGTAVSVSHANSRETALMVYPNPSNDRMVFDVADKASRQTLYLYNTIGQQVYKKEFCGKTEVAKADIGSGIYYYRVAGSVSQAGTISFTTN